MQPENGESRQKRLIKYHLYCAEEFVNLIILKLCFALMIHGQHGSGRTQRLHFSDVGSGLRTSLVSYLLWKKRKERPSGHSTWGREKKVLRWKNPSCLKRSTAPLLWPLPSYLVTCRRGVAEISFHMDLLTLSCCENGKINTVSRWQLSFFFSVWAVLWEITCLDTSSGSTML